MALGTLTVSSRDSAGPNDTLFLDTVSLAGDGAYPTGGSTGLQTALQAVTKDARAIVAVIPVGACGGYVPRWDRANGKLQMFTTVDGGGALAEVTDATDLSATTLKLLVLSK